jgi:hypothetical protein
LFFHWLMKFGFSSSTWLNQLKPTSLKKLFKGVENNVTGSIAGILLFGNNGWIPTEPAA